MRARHPARQVQNGDSTLTFGTGTASKGTLPVYPGNFGCFATLNGLIQTYKPQFYVNGHGERWWRSSPGLPAPPGGGDGTVPDSPSARRRAGEQLSSARFAQTVARSHLRTRTVACSL